MVLETRYRGVILSLELGTSPDVALRINGLERDRARSDAAAVTLRVSSTVQTDYEWHEFIEGTVVYADGEITARLVANNQELVNERYSRKETV